MATRMGGNDAVGSVATAIQPGPKGTLEMLGEELMSSRAAPKLLRLSIGKRPIPPGRAAHTAAHQAARQRDEYGRAMWHRRPSIPTAQALIQQFMDFVEPSLILCRNT